jgi:NTE family protein
MLNAFNRFGLLLLPLILSACASAPLKYPIVTPPQALPIVALKSERPLVALVLGSDGDRGFAHIGVIKVLEKNQIPVDIVVGSSVGSLVGALYAGGFNAADLEALALTMEQGALTDYEFSLEGYIRGERLQDFINQRLDNRSIEQLGKPFAAIATELSSGKATAFNRGNTGLAVRASSSIPGMYRPTPINGSVYVDGGVKAPVPVEVAQKMGADIVIVVDVTSLPQSDKASTNAYQILLQSALIMQQTIAENAIKTAHVVIRPEIGLTPEITPDSKQYLVKAGEHAANEALPAIRYWLSKASDAKRDNNSANKRPAEIR